MKTIKLDNKLRLFFCPNCHIVYHNKKDCDCDELPGDLYEP